MRKRLATAMLGLSVLVPRVALAQPAPASLAPAGWDAGVELKELPDKNPDPRVLEMDLTARMADLEVEPGKAGAAPGPTTAPFPARSSRPTSATASVVHSTNVDLPEDATIHWHGVRVPIEMDGVPGISQPAVPVGGHVHLRLRRAGTPDCTGITRTCRRPPRWASASTAPCWSRSPNDGVGVADEVTLVLSDIGVDTRRQARARRKRRPCRHGVRPRRRVPAGQWQDAAAASRARAGAPQRSRIVNTAKSRFFLLELEGQTFR